MLLSTKTLSFPGILLAVCVLAPFAAGCNSAERRASNRVAELCGGEPDEDMKKLIGALGDDADAERAHQCAADATSCMEAIGCYAGAGLRQLQRGLDSFEGGFERGFGSAPTSPGEEEMTSIRVSAEFKAFVERVCDCGDMNCVEKAQRAWSKRGAELTEHLRPEDAAEMAKQMEPLTERFTDCVERIAGSQ